MLAEAASAYESGESWAAAGGVYVRGRAHGAGRLCLREGGRARDRGEALRGAGDVAPRRRPLRPGRLLLQERRGVGAGRGSREGHRPAAARASPGTRTTAPRPSCWRGSSSRPGGRHSPWSGCRRRWARSRCPPRTSISTTGWPSRTRRRGRPRRRWPSSRRSRRRTCGFRDVNQRVERRGSAAADARAAPPPLPGLRAPPRPRPPRFVPREEIGRGPLGACDRGEDMTDGRSVAMRMLPAALLAPAGRARGARRRPEGGLADLPPQPRQGHRLHGVEGRAVPGHRVRRGPQLRRGHRRAAAA